MLSTDFPHLTLGGDRLSRAWRAVFAAAGSDDDRVELYRTIAIDTYRNGMRLTALDGYLVATAWVGCSADDWAEPIHTTPDRTYVVCDRDRRGLSLMAYVAALAKKAEAEGSTLRQPAVTVRFGVIPDEGPEESLPGMQIEHVAFELADVESLLLPTMDVQFPAWRTMLTERKTVGVPGLVMNPALLERLGKIGKTIDAPVTMAFGGRGKTVRWSAIAHHVAVHGAVMTLDMKRADPTDPDREPQVGETMRLPDPDSPPKPARRAKQVGEALRAAKDAGRPDAKVTPIGAARKGRKRAD